MEIRLKGGVDGILATDRIYRFCKVPVIFIDAYIELIFQECTNNGPEHQYLEKIRSIVQHIRNRILFEGEYSRIGLNGSRWQDVRELIQSAKEAVVTSPIDIGNSTGPLELYADPLFAQVFYHFLKNSVEHGKTFTRIRIGFTEQHGEGHLTFEDNGVGIAPETKPILFVNERPYGCGTGLFLVKENLQISGMNIDETGKPGAGAHFEIRVPEGQYRYNVGAVH